MVRYYPVQWKGNGKKEVNRSLMGAVFKQEMPNDDTADGVGLAYHYLSARRALDPMMYAGEAPEGAVVYREPVDVYAAARAKLAVQRGAPASAAPRKGRSALGRARRTSTAR